MTFVELMDGRPLQVSLCEHYKKKLVYTFYGKPAYRVNQWMGPTSLPAATPVCILLRSEALPQPEGIMPFDSGAMFTEKYKEFLHHRMDASSFELGNQTSIAQRIAYYFYRSNKDYFKGRPRTGLNVPVSELEAYNYYHLILARQQTEFDDRRSAVEIRYAKDIPVNRSTVLAIIAPDEVEDDASLMKKINSISSNIIFYNLIHNTPSSTISIIQHLAMEFYRSSGLL